MEQCCRNLTCREKGIREFNERIEFVLVVEK